MISLANSFHRWLQGLKVMFPLFTRTLWTISVSARAFMFAARRAFRASTCVTFRTAEGVLTSGPVRVSCQRCFVVMALADTLAVKSLNFMTLVLFGNEDAK